MPEAFPEAPHLSDLTHFLQRSIFKREEPNLQCHGEEDDEDDKLQIIKCTEIDDCSEILLENMKRSTRAVVSKAELNHSRVCLRPT